MKLFLTGLPRSGKSTVVMKTIELLKQKRIKVGGFITPEIKERGIRIGFAVKDIYSGKEGILASTRIHDNKLPKLGKYKINVEEFEQIALNSIDFAVKECKLTIIDELGLMEFFSSKFKEKVFEVLESDIPLLAVLHRNLVDKFKKYGKIIEVTSRNRDKLPEEIIKYLGL